MKLLLRWWLVLAVLTSCSSAPPAPVYDRSVAPAGALEADGRYRVRRGDTLYAIAFRFGLDHRDLARWNGIPAPFLIHPEQVLRLAPPATAVARTDRPKPAESVESRPAPAAPSRPGPDVSAPTKTPDRPSPAAAPPTDPEPVVAAARQGPLTWQWPVRGRLLRGFVANNPARNGLDIGGREGQEILAAASGYVVYSGSGLIGYGELIIIKHSERLLSAYAHNRTRLVEEGATVEGGQKIAEMGRNDRNEVLLHFEIRTDGRPVNPMQYLPSP
ncbi:MAG TPA: peptidoglycan DD-metalloendopeptidase family protein [Xanthomonadales bacterium]|nr:peptidoglycan DD-metalloendopeptidase family protein [Xanthomonadales bacterium]